MILCYFTKLECTQGWEYAGPENGRGCGGEDICIIQ